MKTSVIFGVAQMSLGIFLKALNAIHFRKWYDLYFEFIPQIILLWVIFGYMCALIVVKWMSPWPDTSIAPSIIAYLIDMFLNKGGISGQHLVLTKDMNELLHLVLLFIAFVCVPAMLIIKPYLIRKDLNKLLEPIKKPIHQALEMKQGQF